MSHETALRELFTFLEQDRSKRRIDDLVLQWIRGRAEGSIPGGLTADLLHAVLDRRDSLALFEHSSPQALTTFLVDLIGPRKARTVLDPACGTGLTLLAAGQACEAGVLHGCEINADICRIAISLLGEQAEVWQGDAIKCSEHFLPAYDIVISQPPLGLWASDPSVVPGLEGSGRVDLGHSLTVWASAHLSDDGVAVLVLTGSFLWGTGAERIQGAIHSHRCRIRALIHLPGRTMPHVRADSYAVVVERGEQREVFVGQYKDSDEHRMQLVSNYRGARPGSHPALGRICALTDFRGFGAFAARERLKRIAKTSGWVGKPADKVIAAHQVMGKKHGDQLPHASTSCYLRLRGRQLAGTDIEQLTDGVKARENQVLHLHLDPEHVDPRFMVRWFNDSPIGRATLASVGRGSVYQHIVPSDLMTTTLYLPPVSEQFQTLEGDAHLQRIRAAANELENAMWDGTGRTSDIVQAITTINQEDRYEDWVESLPFPLASILWRHHAGGGSYRDRYGVLLHFFEAAAAFLAIVHLSAFMASDDLWNEHGKVLSRKMADQRLSFDRASFGSWKLAAEYLSAVCAKLAKSEAQTELLQRIYGTPSERVLTMISHAGLRSVLQRANKIRNDWSGHTGAISDDKAHQIHDELMELVHALRGVFGRSWLNYELIQPGEGRFKLGVHYYKASRLMGSRSAPFEEVTRESIHPLESDELYLFDMMSQTGLHLKPFVRVMPSREKRANACFFFNRREAGQSRFVSYHFEEESEITDIFPAVDEVLRRLHLFDGDAEA